MTTVAFNKFDCFVLDVANGLHNLKTGTTHVFSFYLTNTLPVRTNTVYNSPAEITAQNGYAAGGLTIGTITGSQASGVFTFIGASDPLWLASGGEFGPFQYAVLYNVTSPTKPLLGWYDYGSALTLTNGNKFQVDTSQISGIFTLT